MSSLRLVWQEGMGAWSSNWFNLSTISCSVEVLANCPQCMRSIWMHISQVPLHGASCGLLMDEKIAILAVHPRTCMLICSCLKTHRYMLQNN